MSDVERRLRDLGERVRQEQGPGALLPNTIRAARLRRIASAFTGLVMVAGLVSAGIFAAGALSADRAKLGPAEEVSDALIEYHRSGGFEGSESRLTIDRQGKSVLYYTEGRAGLTVEGSMSQSELTDLEGAIAAVDWPATDGSHGLLPGVGVEDGYQYELRHDDYVVTTISGVEPQEIKPLIQLLNAFIADERARQEASKPAGCSPGVDFEPTYLPEGWMPQLQEGAGFGSDPFGNVVGHYGAEGPPGGEGKVHGGFIDLVAFNFRYEPPTIGDLITVLGQPAELDEENGIIDFGSDGCAYALVAGSNSRGELVSFAKGLRPRGEQGRSSEPERFGAVWPVDTYDLAQEACDSTESSLADPTSAAREFGYQVLDWNGGARLVEGSGAERKNAQVELARSASEPDETYVLVDLREFQEDCWVVTGVQRSPEESQRYQEYEGASLSVQGREVQAYFADFQDGATAIVEVGYGGEATQHLWQSGDEFAEFQLEFQPRGRGHYLILLRDENGEVFSAFGSPLPSGSFAAG